MPPAIVDALGQNLSDRALKKLEEAYEKIEMAKQCRLEREARRAEKRTASIAPASSF
jgi:acyl-CoA synthetase (NDP forming)